MTQENERPMAVGALNLGQQLSIFYNSSVNRGTIYFCLTDLVKPQKVGLVLHLINLLRY